MFNKIKKVREGATQTNQEQEHESTTRQKCRIHLQISHVGINIFIEKGKESELVYLHRAYAVYVGIVHWESYVLYPKQRDLTKEHPKMGLSRAGTIGRTGRQEFSEC